MQDNNKTSSQKITLAYGDFLKKWSWDWWLTLTFRYPVSQHQAERSWDKWLSALEKTVNDKVHYVRATESQEYRGKVLHYHALLKGTKGQDTIKWENKWFKISGLAKIEPYSEDLGATYYIAKYEHSELVFSKNLAKVKNSEND